jgi:hypothetical protein
MKAFVTLLLLSGCASTVGNYADGGAESGSFDRTDTTADTNHDSSDQGGDLANTEAGEGDVSPDVQGTDATCAAPSFRPCVMSNKECGPCGICTVFSATVAPTGRLVVGDRVCLTAPGGSCTSEGEISDCGSAAVCPMTYGISNPRECIRTEDCLEYERRFYARFPSAVPPIIPHCWYSDATRATTGRLAPARCIRSSVQSCGVGCPCPEGMICNWSSEHSPTGICLPRYFPTFESRGCSRPPRPWNCRNNNSCLLPVRGTVDGVRDIDRAGRCVSREACLEAQRLFGDAYVCVPDPVP